MTIGEKYASNLARKLFGWSLNVGKLSLSVDIKVIRPTFVVARRRLKKENVNKPACCAHGVIWPVLQGVIRPSHMIRCGHHLSICIHICDPVYSLSSCSVVSVISLTSKLASPVLFGNLSYVVYLWKKALYPSKRLPATHMYTS